MTADPIHLHRLNDVRDVRRRGSETCGDIDVIITRSVEDGKTHAGGYLLTLTERPRACIWVLGL